MTKPKSFRPSSKLAEFLEKSPVGVSETINTMFDRYRMVYELEALRLTEDELFHLKEHLMGVVIDDVAIQVIPQDIAEVTQCPSLVSKLSSASVTQCLSTLIKYEII